MVEYPMEALKLKLKLFFKFKTSFIFWYDKRNYNKREYGYFEGNAAVYWSKIFIISYLSPASLDPRR